MMKSSQEVKAESVAIKTSGGITGDQAEEILKELKAIHHLLERQQTAPALVPNSDTVQMSVVAGWYAIGRDDAPITVVEFADYQCPFCRKFHSDTFAELKKNYIDTGKVRFVSRDLPLTFHPNASDAAIAARCAGEQHKFWEMRDLLLENSADLSPRALLKYGKRINLDMSAFSSCVKEKKYASDIQKDVAEAGKMGIGGTPSFVVGKTAKDQIRGVRIAGAVAYSEFETAIKNQLNPSQ